MGPNLGLNLGQNLGLNLSQNPYVNLSLKLTEKILFPDQHPVLNKRLKSTLNLRLKSGLRPDQTQNLTQILSPDLNIDRPLTQSQCHVVAENRFFQDRPGTLIWTSWAGQDQTPTWIEPNQM